MKFYLAAYYDGSQFEGVACDGGISIPFISPSVTARKDDLPGHILHKSSDVGSVFLDTVISSFDCDNGIITLYKQV